MPDPGDAMLLVRADLCDRLAALRALTGRRRDGRHFRDQIASIRRTAALYGLTPVVRLAEALERAPMENDGRRAADLYLDRLDDAIGCPRIDDAASEAMLASVSVRFGA